MKILYDGNGIIDFTRTLQSIDANFTFLPFSVVHLYDMLKKEDSDIAHYPTKSDTQNIALLRSSLGFLSQSRAAFPQFLSLGSHEYVVFCTDCYSQLNRYAYHIYYRENTENAQTRYDEAWTYFLETCTQVQVATDKGNGNTEAKMTMWLAAADVLFRSLYTAPPEEIKKAFMDAQKSILAQHVMPRYAEIAAVVRYATREANQGEEDIPLETARLRTALHLQKRGGWK